MNVVKLKKIDLRPDLASIDADRMLIEETASYIKNLWQQVNAAEMYIGAGREFKNLHGHLSKNSKHDKVRIGWVKAFSEQENKFGCTRQTAESYIAIHDAFFHVANAFATWRLPQSLRALHALVRLKLSADQLQACAADGSLKPDSTEADVRRLARKLKVDASRAARRRAARQPIPSMPSKAAPKKQRIEAAFDLLKKLGLTLADLEKEAPR